MEGLLGCNKPTDVLKQRQKEYLEHSAKTGYLEFDASVPIAYSKAIQAIELCDAYQNTMRELKERFSSDNVFDESFNSGANYVIGILNREVGGSSECSTEEE